MNNYLSFQIPFGYIGINALPKLIKQTLERNGYKVLELKIIRNECCNEKYYGVISYIEKRYTAYRDKSFIDYGTFTAIKYDKNGEMGYTLDIFPIEKRLFESLLLKSIDI